MLPLQVSSPSLRTVGVVAVSLLIGSVLLSACANVVPPPLAAKDNPADPAAPEGTARRLRPTLVSQNRTFLNSNPPTNSGPPAAASTPPMDSSMRGMKGM